MTIIAANVLKNRCEWAARSARRRADGGDAGNSLPEGPLKRL